MDLNLSIPERFRISYTLKEISMNSGLSTSENQSPTSRIIFILENLFDLIKSSLGISRPLVSLHTKFTEIIAGKSDFYVSSFHILGMIYCINYSFFFFLR